MTESKTKDTKETGRTPSMAASLLVCGVMIGLIILSVAFFGTEVAEGPLQISMTLATLFALTVALYYGFGGAVISEAIGNSVNGTMGTIFVLLAIGAIIGTLYLSGTVAAFIAGTIGLSTVAYAPYTFMAYLTPLITVAISVLYFRKDRLPSGDDATAVYGEEPEKLPTPKATA